MSNLITAAFVQSYADAVTLDAQQKQARLLGCVTMKKTTGRRASFDRIGLVNMVQRVSRHADTPLVQTPHSRRWANLSDFEIADLIDQADEVKLLNSPASMYVQAQSAASGRRIDDTVITSFDADADSGQEGGSLISFPSGQEIPDNFGGGPAVGMTIAKFIEAKRLLDAAEVPDDERYIALGSKQLSDLLNTTQVTSADFNTVRALVRGELDTFLGFKVIRTERLIKVSANRKAFAWHKTGLGLVMAQEPKGSIDKRPDKSNSMQAYYWQSQGAVRVEEEKVVRILCKE